MTRLATTAVCIGLGLTSAGIADAQPKPPTIDEIKQAWQRRQDEIKSLRMTYNEVRTQPKGSLEFFGVPPERSGPQPPRDLRLTGQGVVTLDGTRFRLRTERQRWSVEESRVGVAEDESVYSGDKNVSLMVKSPGRSQPDAEITKRQRPLEGLEYTYLPITCYARGQNPRFAPLDLDEYEVADRSPVVNGQRCVELVKANRGNAGGSHVLLDPNRGFTLLRYWLVNRGRVTLRLDVQYAAAGGLDCAPASWDYAITTPAGEPIESKQVKVEVLEINPNLASTEFDLSLPPGTRVYDEYNGQATRYVVRSDGQPGPAVPDASHPTYEQLAALADSEVGGWRRAAAIALVAALVSTATMLWVIRRHHRQPKLP
ncbi:MAG: hypothetical protein K2X82_19785 [Gemmataceae bacterium]|nr:hypothetical protein [Gemmataceae bacterium]